jgi:general secretion pathway protein A
MFFKFFGLKDNPFKLVFDPAFIFMGRRQEEAVAHLRYAVDEGEGFTVITGERGVGKSTLCRVFAESLSADAKAAFISGPVATAGDLLQRINRQFGIEAEGKTAKDLIDSLNKFLMQQRVAGRKVVVFVDDAQALAPEVLEQVRLISNLETTRDKLIQLVLIGEPEMMELLGSRNLRQMGQRVSVCYAAGGLTEAETAAYIQHRLTRASAGPPLRFDPAVVSCVFRQTAGNPRRINLSCTEILAAAFKAGQKAIDVSFAQSVLRDLERQEEHSTSQEAAGRRRMRIRLLAVACGVLVAVAAGFFAWRPTAERPATPAQADPAERPAEPAPAQAVPAPTAEPSSPARQPAAPIAKARPAGENSAAPARDRPTRMTHSVQVGAFLQPEYAQQEMARLTAKGYSARIMKITDSKGKTWLTVRIGDHSSHQAAQAQADEFTRREKMPSVVRPFGGF